MIGAGAISNFSIKIVRAYVIPYCMVEMDSSLSAKYVNMIGPLAKFVRASNSFKIIPRYTEGSLEQ